VNTLKRKDSLVKSLGTLRKHLADLTSYLSKCQFPDATNPLKLRKPLVITFRVLSLRILNRLHYPHNYSLRLYPQISVLHCSLSPTGKYKDNILKYALSEFGKGVTLYLAKIVYSQPL